MVNKSDKNRDWCSSSTLTLRPSTNSLNEIKEYFQEIEELNIETHSACNYASVHCDLCPVSTRTEMFGNFKLETDVIYSLFDDLNFLGYTGRSLFHSYNEPLMDKRIYDILKEHKKRCPMAKTGILTNGKLLNKETGKKLIDAGITQLLVSDYGKHDPEEVGLDESQRISEVINYLKDKYPDVEYNIGAAYLDDRMHFYNLEESKQLKGQLHPCRRVKWQMVITSCGNLQLCCYEWKKENKFGNLNEKSLTDILIHSDFLKVRNDLKRGQREKYYPCDRCLIDVTNSPFDDN